MGKGAKLPDREEHHVVSEAERERSNVQQIEEEAWDDLSGVRLDGKRVREARRVEIEYFRKKGVYKKIP